MIKKTAIAASISSLILIGCGGTDTVSSTVGASSKQVGYFIDSAVINLDYDCLADGEMNLTTGVDGNFSCQNMNRVRFRVGNLVLGEISSLPADSIVMPQDLVDVNRTDIYNERVTEIARFLQSCDSDGNLTNGITIDDTVKSELLNQLDLNTTFDENQTGEYLQIANMANTRTQTQARAHLHGTLQTIIDNTAILDTNLTTGIVVGNGYMHGINGTTPQAGTMLDVNASPLSTLTEETKEAIEYMVNEEKLAYDVYMDLYNYHLSDSNTTLFQFKNVAERSETRHMQIVEDLATKYGLERASDLENGVFNTPELQALYDTLYTQGQSSPIEALKAGCMVEVTDINDLTADLLIAQESNAQDVVDVFTILRDGSYNHYWSFDAALKSMGVDEGCCSVGVIDGVDYCHPEYPQNSMGPRR